MVPFNLTYHWFGGYCLFSYLRIGTQVQVNFALCNPVFVITCKPCYFIFYFSPQVPPVTVAPQNLREYLLGRNITSIVIFGDSQAYRFSKALAEEVFSSAGFTCTKVKVEPRGKQIWLDYYTNGTEFTTHAKVQRVCTTCCSTLRMCLDEKQTKRTVAVEYISLQMALQRSINLSHPECHKNKTIHPLCLNLTQQEYLLKYYLKRQHHPFPQLMLIFSTTAHHQWKPLAAVYDGYVTPRSH